MSHEEFNPVLSDSLGEWKGVGDGSRVRGGGDVCIPVADLC